MGNYDHWKTTEPGLDAHEPFGRCDCCGYERPLFRTWLFPGEAWACEECLDALVEGRTTRTSDD